MIAGFELCQQECNATSGSSSRYSCDVRYAAPEVVRCCGVLDCPNRSYGTAADVWSLGVVAYMLLSGYEPFLHADKASVGSVVDGAHD